MLLNIGVQLIFEVLLMEIGGKNSSYSSYLNKNQNKTEQNLFHDIGLIEQNLLIDHEQLENKRKELSELRKKKMEGVKVRSRAKWMDEGEKVTQYFCHLENRNYISKCMSQLISNSGQVIKDQDDIIKETCIFYKKLYSYSNVEGINLKDELKLFSAPKLTPEEKDSLEGPLTYSEMLVVLKHMANDKSPGSDGFSANFYKFFWKDVLLIMVALLRNCL